MNYKAKWIFWLFLMIGSLLVDILFDRTIVLYKYFLYGLTTYVVIHLFNREKKD